jgi:hypothetical protein
MEIAMKPTASKDPKDQKGEGSYAGARQYNEGVKDHVLHHDVEKEARDAAPRTAAEDQQMKDAEREGASRSKGEDPALRKSKPPK